MGTIVAIIGQSGDGKTTSTIIGPDGNFDPENYQGMDPKSHVILNLDGKALPFRPIISKEVGGWTKDNKNYLEPKDFAQIRSSLEWCAKQPNVKSVSVDTLNIFLAYKEFNDRKKMTFDGWRDIANDIIELNKMCTTLLREDQIAYIFGHTMLQTQPDGTEKQVFALVGKKSAKQPPEGFYTILLMTGVEYNVDGIKGNNRHYFNTKPDHSTVKTPIGMFKEMELPNSLKLVDTIVREFYGMQ